MDEVTFDRGGCTFFGCGVMIIVVLLVVLTWVNGALEPWIWRWEKY